MLCNASLKHKPLFYFNTSAGYSCEITVEKVEIYQKCDIWYIYVGLNASAVGASRNIFDLLNTVLIQEASFWYL